MLISQNSVSWKLLIFPCDLLVLFHSSRWYLTGSFLRFSNSNELSCKKRKNMVLREIEKKHFLKLYLLFTEVLSISSYCCCSVAQSWPTLCDPMDYSMLPRPSPSPGVCSNSYPLSRWCHPTIPSSVVPFSSCLQPFPGWGSFPMSWCFASGGQSIGASASPSILPMNIQG